MTSRRRGRDSPKAVVAFFTHCDAKRSSHPPVASQVIVRGKNAYEQAAGVGHLREAPSQNSNGVSQQSPGFPSFQTTKNSHGFGITHRNHKTLKLTNLRKSGVPWVNVSSILFFSGAARSSQPFMSAPLKNLGSPALRHVDNTPPSQQDSGMKRLIVRGTSDQSHC